MKKLKNIAIIPARGGSKRLPGKNLLPLNGKPLIEHTLEYVKDNMTIIDRIVVSTDDIEIKKVAQQNEIMVIDRPEALAGDLVPTVDVLKHVLEVVDEEFDTVFLFQVTNPLRPRHLLANAYDEFLDGNYDSLMTVTRNHQKFGKIVNDRFQPFNYILGQRSQDLEPLYFENGLLYITEASLILKGSILGNNNHPFIVNHAFANVDIDTAEDLNFASFIAEQEKKRV